MKVVRRLVPYGSTKTIKNKLLHHEDTKSTKFFNDSPLLRVLCDFVVRISGCGLRPR